MSDTLRLWVVLGLVTPRLAMPATIFKNSIRSPNIDDRGGGAIARNLCVVGEIDEEFINTNANNSRIFAEEAIYGRSIFNFVYNK